MGKDAREAKRVATQQAAAAQPDMSAAFSGLGKQMVLVPAMWLSQKIDFTKEGNLQILFFVFSAVMIGGYLTVGLAQRRVHRAGASREVGPLHLKPGRGEEPFGGGCVPRGIEVLRHAAHPDALQGASSSRLCGEAAECTTMACCSARLWPFVFVC